jgi:uncharacterized RDD family membrane protein YckC
MIPVLDYRTPEPRFRVTAWHIIKFVACWSLVIGSAPLLVRWFGVDLGGTLWFAFVLVFYELVRLYEYLWPRH